MYHYRECGLDYVWLVNGYRTHDTPYGKGVSIDNSEGLHRAIALAIIEGRPRLSGSEFRYLRKAMELSQKRFGDIFDLTDQTVALWEKNDKLPKWADLAIRAMYLDRLQGSVKLADATQAAVDGAQAPDAVPTTVAFEETDQGWQRREAAAA